LHCSTEVEDRLQHSRLPCCSDPALFHFLAATPRSIAYLPALGRLHLPPLRFVSADSTRPAAASVWHGFWTKSLHATELPHATCMSTTRKVCLFSPPSSACGFVFTYLCFVYVFDVTSRISTAGDARAVRHVRRDAPEHGVTLRCRDSVRVAAVGGKGPEQSL